VLVVTKELTIDEVAVATYPSIKGVIIQGVLMELEVFATFFFLIPFEVYIFLKLLNVLIE
jgi:hypothetical protein